MKSKIIFSFLCSMVCAIFLFLGCGSDLMTDCEKRVSDIRENYFQGQTENYFVSFSSGMRESPYELDGICNEKVEFGVVTIVPKKTEEQKGLTYIVSVNDKEHSGEFETSPFDDSYAGDIGVKVGASDVITIKISDGSSEEIASMTCVTCDFDVDALSALQLAVEEVGNNLQDLMVHKNFEIYIKVVADIKQVVENKYWLVMFYCECGEFVNVIINPETGDCEVKNV